MSCVSARTHFLNNSIRHIWSRCELKRDVRVELLCPLHDGSLSRSVSLAGVLSALNFCLLFLFSMLVARTSSLNAGGYNCSGRKQQLCKWSLKYRVLYFAGHEMLSESAQSVPDPTGWISIYGGHDACTAMLKHDHCCMIRVQHYLIE